MHRRELLLATGSLALMAGCVGDDGLTNDGTSTTDTGSQTETVSDSETPSSDIGIQIETVNAGDVRPENDEQRVAVVLSGVEGGEVFDVYVNITSLTTANVGLDEVSAVVETRYAYGWIVSDAEIMTGEDVVVRATVEINEDDSVDGTGNVRFQLTDLATSDLQHTTDLQHHAIVTDRDDSGNLNFTAGTSGSYDAIQPDELKNVLRVRPDRIRIGEERQEVHITIDHATSEIDFRMDLTPLTDVGILIDTAGVELDTIENNVSEDLEGAELTETGVVDGVLHLDLVTEDDMVGLIIEITGLDTDDAEPADELRYPVYVGKRPTDPTESQTFSIEGATA